MIRFPRAFLLALLLPLTASRATETLPLAGEWRFEISGTDAEGYSRELPGEIRLPGTMDDAGLGPKNTKAPTLEGPYRWYNYAGPAWYQRDIEIPAGWQGKRVSLFLERCRWVTTVWLDDQCVGSQDSLIAPHVFDFGTAIAPGKHRLTICVDNTIKINLGVFVSVLYGGVPGNMNGIIGRIELAATPPVWIDDVQVYPDVDKKVARVVVKIGNDSGKAGHGKMSVGGKNVDAAWDINGGQAEVTVDMSGAKLWDEFSPNLSEMKVKLGEDERTVRFGMRKFEARGTQFAMNGRTLFLRGTLECSVFPLTGYPPTDVAAWQRIFRIMKSYGLNFVRFHSWCPPDAAFEAADIEGIMIQAEGPIANVTVGEDANRDQFVEAEFKRMVDTYGNHPSFCTMTLGNEFGGKDELLEGWVDMLIRRDPRHLYASASSGQKTANRQWTETGDGRGVHGPDTERDLSQVVAADARPNIGHEIGQWMYYPDFKEIEKYTGVMAVKNFEMIRDDLEKKHQLDLAPKYFEASGKLATLLYKEEIEVLLRTPGYAGFSLLDLHDYPTQGTALIGPLNPFWESKGFITPEAFRQYCGPTVPLLRMPKRTYTNDESFDATAEVAHYGPADLMNAQPVWKITDEQGGVVVSGTLPAVDLPTGRLTELGAIKASLGGVHAPGKFTVSVALEGTQFVNSWEIWVYPAQGTPTPPAGVVMCNEWGDVAKSALADGKKVFLMTTKVNNSLPGSLKPVFWSPVWFPTQKPNTMGLLCDPAHPALAQFPTELSSNWQWWDIINQSRSVILDSTPPGFRPIVQVIDNFARNHKLGVLFEARVGKGSLLFCSMDLKSGLERRPAASQLLASLYAYLGSDRFKPADELSPDLLDQLFARPTSVLLNLGARVIQADSEAPGHPASNAIDGDSTTFWHTKWQPVADPMPHEIVIDMKQERIIEGVTYLPREDSDSGRVAQCAVYCGSDPAHWGAAAGSAKFRNSDGVQKIEFQQPVKGRYLKFTVQSEIRSHPFASVAEIDVMLAKP